MFHKFGINGKTPIINSTCTKLKPLDIICLPSEMKMEFTHTGRALAEKIEWGQTSKSHDKNLIQSLVMQDFDPDGDMEEIDIEATLLETELKEHKKRK